MLWDAREITKWLKRWGEGIFCEIEVFREEKGLIYVVYNGPGGSIYQISAGMLTRIWPQGPGQGQGPDTQGPGQEQGPDPKDKDKDLTPKDQDKDHS